MVCKVLKTKALVLMIGVAGLVAGKGLAEENRTYTLLLRDIPLSGQNCHSLADEIAQKFSQLTTYSTQGRCEALQEESADLSLKYQAPQSVDFITSSPDLDFPGRAYEFSSRRECELNLESEKYFFQSVQGTEPLLVFCRSKANYYGRVRWELALYGLAQSRILPQWASSRFPGKPDSDQIQRIIEGVKVSFTNSDMNVRFAFLQDGEKGELRFTTMYYGKYGEQLKAFSLAEVRSLQECEQELKRLKELNIEKPALMTLGYCVPNPYARGANLVAIVNVLKWYRLDYAVESFQNYSDCAAQRPTLLKFYQEKSGDKIAEGFCTRWGSQWKLNLLNEP